MLRWKTVSLNATYSIDRYRAVSRKHEYRIFHDPEERHRLPWILVVREGREGGAPAHVHHGAYLTEELAKRAAERWEGPPPQG